MIARGLQLWRGAVSRLVSPSKAGTMSGLGGEKRHIAKGRPNLKTMCLLFTAMVRVARAYGDPGFLLPLAAAATAAATRQNTPPLSYVYAGVLRDGTRQPRGVTVLSSTNRRATGSTHTCR